MKSIHTLLFLQSIFLIACTYVYVERLIFARDPLYDPKGAAETISGTIGYWEAVGPLEEVALWIQATKHYQLTSHEGAMESDLLLPPSGHLVTLEGSAKGENYTLGMFHQLRCIQLLRNDLRKFSKSRNVNSCLRYLWQSVLCSGNVQLEGVFVPRNMTTVAPTPRDYRCKNWQKVFDAAERVRHS